MTAIKHIIYLCIGFLSCLPAVAQVPVSEEPMHHNVFQNEYIRLLDVWLQPGDTTMFHIHATPSLFVILSNTATGSQIKGENWANSRSAAGTTWYRSFSPDILVHRVCNLDTVPFHVNDIELLSGYNTDSLSSKKPLPFHGLFDNEKAFAYQLKGTTIKRQIIKDRGPMIVELVSGKGVTFHNVQTNQSKEVIAGKYLYIEAGATFYFTAGETEEINMVLFELK